MSESKIVEVNAFSYEIDFDKVKTFEELKIVLAALGIGFTSEHVQKKGIQEYVKEVNTTWTNTPEGGDK